MAARRRMTFGEREAIQLDIFGRAGEQSEAAYHLDAQQYGLDAAEGDVLPKQLVDALSARQSFSEFTLHEELRGTTTALSQPMRRASCAATPTRPSRSRESRA